MHPNNHDPKYIATVKNVKEVSLVATADLAYWREKLEPAGLFPFSHDGKARLNFSATEFRYLGKQTNELTVGVAVSIQADGCSMDGQFLVHAFNSSRLFAWIERTLFKTPYFPGTIRLDDQVPARLMLSDARGPVIQAQMDNVLAPTHSQDEHWQGAIYLPSNRKQPSKLSRFFYASLGGLTAVYPYLISQCSFTLLPRVEYPFMQWLVDSQAAPLEWRICSQAVHARTKTYLSREKKCIKDQNMGEIYGS